MSLGESVRIDANRIDLNLMRIGEGGRICMYWERGREICMY